MALIHFMKVSDVYKRPSLDSPAKAALEETSHLFENRGLQLLGQIKHGSCRPRAILFKVLADSVGLESSLVVVSSCGGMSLYSICNFFFLFIIIVASVSSTFMVTKFSCFISYDCSLFLKVVFICD